MSKASAPQMQEHLVLLVHGIRTTAQWAGMVKEALERTSSGALRVEPVSYGIFSLWRFLLPGPSRRAPVAAVSKYLRAVRARDNDLAKAPDERRLVSVVAHSFGTYCLFQVLDQNPNIKLHRVILCGSVLPQAFDVSQYRGQLGPSKVLNECGDRDPWPVVAKKIAWGCGSAGTFGLFDERVTNRFHRNGHIDYFDAGFVRDMWLSFLEHGEVRASDWDTERSEHPSPRWIRTLNVFPAIPLVVFLGVCAAFALAPEFRCWFRSDSCPAPPIPGRTWGEMVGGDGGRPFGPLTCRSSEALVGLYGKAGSNGDARIFSIGPICATAHFDRADQIRLLSVGTPRRGDDAGSNDGEPFELSCPPNMVVVGSELGSVGFSTGYTYIIDHITLKCSGILSFDDASSVKSVSRSGTQISFATRRSFSCPDGSAAIAIQGKADQWIDALGIGCENAELPDRPSRR